MIETRRTSQSKNEQEENGYVRPITVYTGPKTLADAKLALGEWLEEHGV